MRRCRTFTYSQSIFLKIFANDKVKSSNSAMKRHLLTQVIKVSIISNNPVIRFIMSKHLWGDLGPNLHFPPNNEKTQTNSKDKGKKIFYKISFQSTEVMNDKSRLKLSHFAGE